MSNIVTSPGEDERKHGEAFKLVELNTQTTKNEYLNCIVFNAQSLGNKVMPLMEHVIDYDIYRVSK